MLPSPLSSEPLHISWVQTCWQHGSAVSTRPSPLLSIPSEQFGLAGGPSTIGSIVQVALHPSPAVVFPSSHCSPGWSCPFPQTGADEPVVQHEEHPSPSRKFPSSHCSPGCIVPSPQYVSRRRARAKKEPASVVLQSSIVLAPEKLPTKVRLAPTRVPASLKMGLVLLMQTIPVKFPVASSRTFSVARPGAKVKSQAPVKGHPANCAIADGVRSSSVASKVDVATKARSLPLRW